MFTTATVTALVLVTLPLIFLFWLTESQEQKICRMYKTKRYTQQHLADKFGVSRTTISRRLKAATT